LKKVWFFRKRAESVEQKLNSKLPTQNTFQQSSPEVGKLPKNTLSKSVRNFMLGVTKFLTLLLNRFTTEMSCILAAVVASASPSIMHHQLMRDDSTSALQHARCAAMLSQARTLASDLQRAANNGILCECM
jgi:hypothetical protein